MRRLSCMSPAIEVPIGIDSTPPLFIVTAGSVRVGGFAKRLTSSAEIAQRSALPIQNSGTLAILESKDRTRGAREVACSVIAQRSDCRSTTRRFSCPGRTRASRAPSSCRSMRATPRGWYRHRDILLVELWASSMSVNIETSWGRARCGEIVHSPGVREAVEAAVVAGCWAVAASPECDQSLGPRRLRSVGAWALPIQGIASIRACCRRRDPGPVTSQLRACAIDFRADGRPTDAIPASGLGLAARRFT